MMLQFVERLAFLLITNEVEAKMNSELKRNKKYRAAFAGINSSEKQEFKNSKCIMGISVGQQYHEGGKFLSTINTVNKNFNYCNILIADTLQKHTMAIDQQDKDERELYTLSKKAGDDWLERNMPYISTMNIPCIISRWDEWLENDRYQYYHTQVYKLYNNDSMYKEAVNQTAYQFLLKKDAPLIKDQKLAFNLCIQYLLEEAAVACIYTELDYKFTVYPSKGNLAVIIAPGKLIQNEIASKAKFVTLRIKEA